MSTDKIARFGAVAKALTAWLKDAALLSLAIFLLVTAWRLSPVLKQAEQLLRDSDQAAVTLRQSSIDQSKRIAAIETEIGDLVRTGKLTIQSANEALLQVKKIATDVDIQIPVVSGAVVDTTKHVDVAATKLSGVFDATTQTIAALNVNYINNVAIKEAIFSTASSTKQIAANTETISSDAEHVVHSLRGKYDDAQKPQPWYKKYPLMVAKAALFGLTIWHPF